MGFLFYFLFKIDVSINFRKWMIQVISTLVLQMSLKLILFAFWVSVAEYFWTCQFIYHVMIPWADWKFHGTLLLHLMLAGVSCSVTKSCPAGVRVIRKPFSSVLWPFLCQTCNALVFWAFFQERAKSHAHGTSMWRTAAVAGATWAPGKSGQIVFLHNEKS